MRNSKMDNIKVFLIFCVILGHMLELVAPGGTLYRTIYSFHMPAFLFISGYFARFDSKKIISRLIYPYFLFQTAYLLFATWIVQKDIASLILQFTTPYWLLWYLMVIIFYNLLLPFFQSIDRRILFGAACVLSLAAGFEQTVGYYLTLSRFFTFLPYFVLGVILSRANLDPLLKNRVFRITTAVVAAVSCWLMYSQIWISVQALYGSYSYAEAGSSIAIRALLLLVGINWIFFFLCYFPKRRIPLISSVGQYTFILYLVHGFVKLYLASRGGFFVYSRCGNIGLAAFLTLILILIFGNQYVSRALLLIFTGRGAELLWRKIMKQRIKQQGRKS